MHQDWILWGVLPPYLRRTLSRRDAVRLLSVAGAASLAGCGGGGTVAATTATTTTTSSASCTKGSSTTEGPYWVDGDTASPLRSNIEPDTITTTDLQGTIGVPLSLTFAVYTYASGGCTPLQNARVDVWHANAVGVYSEEATQNETKA